MTKNKKSKKKNRMDDEQPSYSSVANGKRRVGKGFDVFPIYKGTGEDFAKMFVEEEVQPTDNELGLGAIYDDLECFGGGKKRRKKKKKVGKHPSNIKKAYQARVKKLISLFTGQTSAADRKKIYKGFVKSLSESGAKNLAVSSDKDLISMIQTYHNAYKNKKKK